ncbi:MAG: hemoglobin [Acidobacteriota bacterium]|jgi:hemoglobin|nr:hemoglobin [Acidobacteriota bacterium]
MNMRRTALRQLLPVFTLALALAWGGAPKAAAQDGQKGKSLYERLGGYNAIAAVVDDFVGRLVTDKQFERFFVGHSTDSKKRIRQHIVDQFCAAAGGPCIYTGRSMKDSHQGMGITEAEWDAAAKHLVATLDKFKVGEQEKKDLLAFVGSLKNDIVEKK